MLRAYRRVNGSFRHPGMYLSYNVANDSQTQVGEWTPFVIEFILYPGNMLLEISVCFFATPLTNRLIRNARRVIFSMPSVCISSSIPKREILPYMSRTILGGNLS